MKAIHASRLSPWGVRWSPENRGGSEDQFPGRGGQGVGAWRFGEVSCKRKVERVVFAAGGEDR
jgi:hypothetical protein